VALNNPKLNEPGMSMAGTAVMVSGDGMAGTDGLIRDIDLLPPLDHKAIPKPLSCRKSQSDSQTAELQKQSS
jgi:hypothetical protein